MDKLLDYLDSTRRAGETAYERYARFGQAIGASEYRVRKWVYRQRRVPDRFKIAIAKATKGHVDVADLVMG